MEHYYFYHDDIKTGLKGEGCGYLLKSGGIFADKKILEHGKVMLQRVK